MKGSSNLISKQSHPINSTSKSPNHHNLNITTPSHLINIISPTNKLIRIKKIRSGSALRKVSKINVTNLFLETKV